MWEYLLIETGYFMGETIELQFINKRNLLKNFKVWLDTINSILHQGKKQIPLSICTWFLQFSSLKYWVWWIEFLVYFKLEFYRLQQAEKSSSNWEKNPVYQTGYLKLENCKNQVQIDRGIFSHLRYHQKKIRMLVTCRRILIS